MYSRIFSKTIESMELNTVSNFLLWDHRDILDSVLDMKPFSNEESQKIHIAMVKLYQRLDEIGNASEM